jgi:hypothetical protein
MAEATVPDRPNIHSKPFPSRLSYLKYVPCLGFQDNPPRKRPPRAELNSAPRELHLIKLTEQREITHYLWVHPDEER